MKIHTGLNSSINALYKLMVNRALVNDQVVVAIHTLLNSMKQSIDDLGYIVQALSNVDSQMLSRNTKT